VCIILLKMQYFALDRNYMVIIGCSYETCQTEGTISLPGNSVPKLCMFLTEHHGLVVTTPLYLGCHRLKLQPGDQLS
jgi:hypothetical protein